MILLDYTNRFEFKFDLSKYDFDMFGDVIILFKQMFIKFDKTTKVWWCTEKQIEDMWAYLEKYNYTILASPKARKKIKEILDKRKPEIDIDRSISFDPSVFKEHVKPFQFQLTAMNKLVKRNRTYLADEAGLGKTLESLGTFSTWYKHNKIDGVLIVVRNGLEYPWRQEIIDKSAIFKEDDIQIIDNSIKVKPFEVYKDKKILLIPNHLLGDILASYRKDFYIGMKLSNLAWESQTVSIPRAWEKQNVALVIDEAHEVTNTKAVVTKALFSHKHQFNYRLPMSATPAITRFSNWWSCLALLDESLIGKSQKSFNIWISETLGNKWDKFFVESYNINKVKEVKDIIALNVIKRTKEELEEMKTKKDERPIFLPLHDLHSQMYIEFAKQEVMKIEDEYDKITLELILAKYPYLIQIIDNPFLLKGKIENPNLNMMLAKWKFEDDTRYNYLKSALHDYVDLREEKVLIFDHHPLTLNMLAEKFKKYNPLVIHGQTGDTKEEKFEKENLFNDPKSKNKILFLSSLMSAGLNLNKASRRAIYWSLPSDPVAFSQSIDRVHRINNTQDAHIEFCVLDRSIDMIRYRNNVNRSFINTNILKEELTSDVLMKYINGTLI